jgi:LuxR family transcriptional regulator, maltose regulon positive regulatory protein
MVVINCVNDKFVPTPLPEICAPAGYGKTVSALLWIEAAKRRSVWIGLDEYDNAPFVFYKLSCTGIRSVQPDNTKMEEILNSKAF